jgi:hypothetical protein
MAAIPFTSFTVACWANEEEVMPMASNSDNNRIMMDYATGLPVKNDEIKPEELLKKKRLG